MIQPHMQCGPYILMTQEDWTVHGYHSDANNGDALHRIYYESMDSRKLATWPHLATYCIVSTTRVLNLTLLNTHSQKNLLCVLYLFHKRYYLFLAAD